MNVISPATRLLLSLSMLKGVGPAALKKVALIPGFGEQTIEELAENIPQIARALSGGSDWQIAQDDATKQVNDAERHHARILSPLDSEYPRLLAATKDDPFILYVQGSLAEHPEQSVAIIGTREPTAHGNVIATRVTQFFTERSWSIVSGLAIGCDAIAHKAALDAGAHTVAVLAHGLHMIAPTRHKKLAEKILAAGGALVSEYPFGQNVQNQQYVKRDRTQAGMAQGVVMIQSDIKGGSLHASRAALDYGRWLAVPYPTDKDRESGEPKVQANLLIADGTDDRRADLLRCPTSTLKRVIILRGREDYFLMVDPAGGATSGSPSPHISKGQIKPDLSSGQRTTVVGAMETDEIDSVAGRSAESTSPNEPRTVARAPVVIVPEVSRELISPERPARCRVVVSQNHSSDPKIKLMPPTSSKGFKKAAALVHDVCLLGALSARLQYIQARLDAVGRMRCDNESPRGKENRLIVQFSVEDVLAQMKRAVDVIVALDSYSAAERASLNTPKNSVESSSQEQANLLGRVQQESRKEYSLQELLNCLLDSCPQSVGFDDELDDLFGVRDYVHPEGGTTDVYLDHLVSSFNELIASVFFAEGET